MGASAPPVDWTEKYRPRTVADLVGNGPSVRKMVDWAKAWQEGRPGKRALVLAGPPGVGKTSAALALAHDMDWAIIELNASDARNADRIRRVATAGALHQTFGDDGAFHSHTDPDAGRKLIILDEADNLYERLSGENAAGGGSNLSDKGGKTQIIATIKETKQPIILIVNDLYALTKGSGSGLKSLAETLKWQKVNVRSIPKALARIAREEGVEVDPKVFEVIAQNAGGDLRAAVRDLQSLCAGRKQVTLQHLASAGYRDSSGTPFDVVRHVLKGKDLRDLRREVWAVDATPADLVLWIDENLPKEYVHPEDLVAGYDMLSRADRFLGRTQRKQNYRLWAYASDLATLGVSAVKQHPGPRKFTPFGFPQWLSKMSRSRGARQLKDNLAVTLGQATHQSRRKARMDQVAVFEALFQADEEFAAHQTARIDLSADQVAVLLGDKPTSAPVKRIMEKAAEMESQEDERGPAGGLGSFDDGSGDLDDEADDGGHQGEETKQKEKVDAHPSAGAGQQRLF